MAGFVIQRFVWKIKDGLIQRCYRVSLDTVAIISNFICKHAFPSLNQLRENIWEKSTFVKKSIYIYIDIFNKFYALPI